ncbi:hypothetical protein MesoLj131c_22560 [Mesorhizobium sp. 131-3-5]|nr:hypothetical protein MesoLj131b_23090 [Mesorhizobium sp. 131-2-5]BCH07998.1 hypothetical protein MesoLj131c_22560 [Mesorhizobium sp. 131-3-5]
MLEKIAFVALMVQVAVLATLVTKTVFMMSYASEETQPAGAAVVKEIECANATWPNIPDHCLERGGGSTKSVKTLVLTAQN